MNKEKEFVEVNIKLDLELFRNDPARESINYTPPYNKDLENIIRELFSKCYKIDERWPNTIEREWVEADETNMLLGYKIISKDVEVKIL
jgi:hypothetical protein